MACVAKHSDCLKNPLFRPKKNHLKLKNPVLWTGRFAFYGCILLIFLFLYISIYICPGCSFTIWLSCFHCGELSPDYSHRKDCPRAFCISLDKRDSLSRFRQSFPNQHSHCGRGSYVYCKIKGACHPIP